MLQLPGAQALRSRRVIGRTLFATALLTASAAVSVVPAATAAPQAPAAAAPARSDAGAPAFQQVAHFYAAYIDAVTAQGGGKLATALRSFYLTPQLRTQLATWEQRNHADGVLRAQNTPLAFRVTSGDSGAGHTWSTVRLTWSKGKHPRYSYLTVRSDLRTYKISGIGE
ncbi:hypothetical protein [Streptomyces sp. NBC_01618]|uniref:hypothetical protein n=1 Tax=Streptomyces sp. NBC_01618 TaxID=2975900 RepID=UPI0038636A83|nr:hypothetical protein OH735_12750 [Streptomyces sp. NBC_01618]